MKIHWFQNEKSDIEYFIIQIIFGGGLFSYQKRIKNSESTCIKSVDLHILQIVIVLFTFLDSALFLLIVFLKLYCYFIRIHVFKRNKVKEINTIIIVESSKFKENNVIVPVLV